MFENPNAFKLLLSATKSWKKSGLTRKQWEEYAVNMAAKSPDSIIGDAMESGNLMWVSKFLWEN